jgi:hypothetical protein
MDECDAELEAVFNFAELVGDQLLPPVLPVSAAPGEEEDSVAPVRPLIAEQASPAELLAWALFMFRRCVQPALKVRRRCSRKGSDLLRLAETASGLRCDMAFDCGVRKDARWFFQGLLAVAVGAKVTHVKEEAGRLWAAAPVAVTDRWCALHALVGRRWRSTLERSLKVDVARRVSVCGYGFLLTYFTDLHRELPRYPDWIGSWVTSAQLRAELGQCRQVDAAFDDFWRFIQALRKAERPLEWVGCCFEVCMESRVRGRIHAHAYVSLDPLRMAGGNEVLPVELTLAELRWRGVTPHVVPLGMKAKSRPNFHAAATGYYYVTATKATQIRVRGNQRLFQEPRWSVIWIWCVCFSGALVECAFDFHCVCVLTCGRCLFASCMYSLPRGCRQEVHPPPSSIMSLYRKRKIDAEVAKEDLSICRDPAAPRLHAAVSWFEQQESERRFREWEFQVASIIEASLRPFRVLPRVVEWQAQFRVDQLALRYQCLALIGPSRAGKTNFALSLFGRRKSLVVNCQCLGGNLPDIRRLDVAYHEAIVWDECDPRQILNNKVVFQSGPFGVTLAQSACNAHAYVKYLHRVAHIVCANSFVREAGDTCADGTILSDADADWLRSNVCFIDLAPHETLFHDEAGEDQAVTGLDALSASSGGGPAAVSW